MSRQVRKLIEGWTNDLRMVRNRGSFARNAAVTFSGVMVTTGAQVLLTPLITRLYGPEAYAVYGLFMAITTNVSLLSTGAYPLAFMLPDREEHFIELLRGTLGRLLLATGMSLLILPFRHTVFSLAPGWSILGPWFLLLPLSVLLHALTQVLSQTCFRHKAFSVPASFNAGFNVSLRSFNVIFGWLSSGALYGLVLGEVIVRALALGMFVKPLREMGIWKALTTWPTRRSRAMLRRFKRYPRFVLPTRWLTLLSGQLPLFFLAAAQAPAALGQYAMAGALLLIPLNLFGHSLNAVFMQKATETLRLEHTKLPSITSRLFNRLLAIGVVPFAIQIIYGDLIFGILLGKDWIGSGIFSAMLGPFFFFRLLAEPMVSLFAVLGREKRLFGFQIANVALAAIALFLGIVILGDVHLGILFYGIGGTVIYAYLSARILYLAGNRWLPHIGKALFLLALTCTLAALSRKLLLGDLWMSF